MRNNIVRKQEKDSGLKDDTFAKKSTIVIFNSVAIAAAIQYVSILKMFSFAVS